MAEHLKMEPLTMTIAEYSKIHKVNQRYLRRIVTANKKQLFNESYGIISFKLLGKTYILTVVRPNPDGTKNEILPIKPNKVINSKSLKKTIYRKNKHYMIRFDSREIAKTYMKYFTIKIMKSESLEQFMLIESPTKNEWELYQVIIELLRKRKINIETRELY